MRSIIFRKKKLRKVEKTIKILNDYFVITEQTLGLVPTRPSYQSISTSSNQNDLQSYLASTKGLSSYINEMMKSKLGGKKKLPQPAFMNSPHRR